MRIDQGAESKLNFFFPLWSTHFYSNKLYDYVESMTKSFVTLLTFIFLPIFIYILFGARISPRSNFLLVKISHHDTRWTLDKVFSKFFPPYFLAGRATFLSQTLKTQSQLKFKVINLLNIYFYLMKLYIFFSHVWMPSLTKFLDW